MKKLFLLLLLALLRVVPGGAAPLPPPPDSLRAVLAAAPAGSAQRIDALLRIARAQLDPPLPAALAYAQAAEQEARRQGNDVGMGQALDVQGDFHWLSQQPARALPFLGRAEPLLRGAEPGVRALNLYHLAVTYTDLRRQRPALAYYRRAYALAALAPDSAVQRAEIINSLGVFYLSYERPDSAAYYLFRAVRRQHALGRPQAEASTLNNLSAVFYQREQYPTSVRYARQALSIQRTLADTIGQLETLNTLAVLAQHDSPDSKRAGHDSLLAAMRYYQTAARLVRHLHQPGTQAELAFSMGQLYLRLGRPDSAEAGLRRALHWFLREDDEAASCSPRMELGRLMFSQGRLDEASSQLQQARSIARRHGQIPDELTALDLLASVAVRRSDYRMAYRLSQRQKALGDSLVVLDNRRLTAELRARYETEQAEQQVALLTKQQEVVSLRQQRTAIAGVAGALLLLGAGAGLLAWYRRRQRQREVALRQRLAADLHDDVGSLLTQVALEGALLRHEQPTAPQLLRVNRLVTASQQAVRQLRDVVWSVDAQNDSFSALLDRLRDHAHEVLSLAEVEVDFFADPALTGEPLSLEARQALYLIFKESLHNIVKHARATVVTIRLGRDGRWLNLTVQDDGVGLPANLKSSGHGLANMKRRAAGVGGDVVYETPTEGGHRVRVQLPVV
jgi:signal transduction histidine kinase